MKPFIWFILAIFLILAGCASGTNSVSQYTMFLAPTGSSTLSPSSSDEDQARPGPQYNVAYYPMVSF
jgi:uncharacterized lipoprotein YmbA